MMSVKYKRSRGGADGGEEGADVTTSKAWLIEVLCSDHDKTAEYIGSIPEETKNQILEHFDGEDVFESSNTAQAWIN